MRGVTSEQDFSLTVINNPAISAPVYSPFIDRDANFSTITGSLTANNFIISVIPSLVFPGTPVFESVTSDTATVDATGAVTRVADGDAKILVRFPSPSACVLSRDECQQLAVPRQTIFSHLSQGRSVLM